jgi:hypothetical protein
MAIKKTRRRFASVLMRAVILLLIVGQRTVAQSGESFKARLFPVPIDALTKSTITGSGSVTAVLMGRNLTINGNFEGMRSAATDAHIHRGPKGIRGPAIFDLNVSKATRGTISGSIEVTPSQIEDLRNGRFYVQINSERAPAPDGNLWGWLLH